MGTGSARSGTLAGPANSLDALDSRMGVDFCVSSSVGPSSCTVGDADSDYAQSQDVSDSGSEFSEEECHGITAVSSSRSGTGTSWSTARRRAARAAVDHVQRPKPRRGARASGGERISGGQIATSGASQQAGKDAGKPRFRDHLAIVDFDAFRSARSRRRTGVSPR